MDQLFPLKQLRSAQQIWMAEDEFFSQFLVLDFFTRCIITDENRVSPLSFTLSRYEVRALRSLHLEPDSNILTNYK